MRGRVIPAEHETSTPMTAIIIKSGDLLDEAADVLVSTANPWLNMSGGVNGAILQRGGETIQAELHAFLRNSGRSSVDSGTVVVTGPGRLNVRQILHAVAIDPFYDSSVDLIRQTIERVLATARQLGARTLAMPALATGFGHLSMEQFAAALASSLETDHLPIERIAIVLRREEDAATVRHAIETKKFEPRE